ncbi:ribonuclease Z [Listeria monocytogenes]|uniref:Ribonuclease Z n=2 Tax=Listeria monocytogenes TaxID=1639 RepID=RNZ_LISMH|nr:ribonuclease Z [Listeria monocytogenes]B8DBV5.1 RecName: Full=Ribonuclease Z; Short=RNase Z; AltName: Full=tRNA 3 endonuclease; AltName: Full=tRNase Z [Listeria monocytogenes HCC23]MCY61909.1 ribonuclease Z [Listeria monocytogenes serotype 4c]ACK38941.1 ribonuclease Z [Listeria monocytogenes HCC23]AEH93069.1 putative ribonuclease Z [Listeria monocytogenes M7]AKS54578.1 ribonuclease Z [Listeria monocytogenes]EAC6861017.1 ribonuclease Z [Listeria monocytogenes]
MELVFLGTGAGVPSRGRNVTSIALSMLNERNAIWLFDCGEATQHQIMRSQIKLSKLEKIFITHLHGDHIFGLPGLLSSRSFQGGESDLTIYGPVGITEYVETSLRLSGTRLTYKIIFNEIEPGLIFEDKMFSITVDELDHGLRSFGYRIVEKDKPGALNADKLIEDGVEPGPIFQKIKKGETVTLADGSVINGKDYIDEPQKGKIISIFGDTKATASELELALNADVLVHEATFEGDKEKLAGEYMHSTTLQAASLAKKANVKKLILTHISSRYDRDASKELLIEAQSVFENTEIAYDLAVFPIGE